MRRSKLDRPNAKTKLASKKVKIVKTAAKTYPDTLGLFSPRFGNLDGPFLTTPDD